MNNTISIYAEMLMLLLKYFDSQKESCLAMRMISEDMPCRKNYYQLWPIIGRWYYSVDHFVISVTFYAAAEPL